MRAFADVWRGNTAFCMSESGLTKGNGSAGSHYIEDREILVYEFHYAIYSYTFKKRPSLKLPPKQDGCQQRTDT
jgi:hypothetical protein